MTGERRDATASLLVAVTAGGLVPVVCSAFSLAGTGPLAIASGLGAGVAAAAVITGRTRRALERQAVHLVDQLSEEVAAIASRLAAPPGGDPDDPGAPLLPRQRGVDPDRAGASATQALSGGSP